MKELKEKLGLNSTELLVLIVFFLFSLRVLNWFEYPYMVIGGDFRQPLIQEAFLKRITSTWDEIDFGIPSIYSPRILDPFYLFATASQILGVSPYVSQIIAVFLVYLFSSILMYIFVKQLTKGNITASFVAALYLTSNVYLINDREVTAIGFVNTALLILPCLVTFVKGINSKSYKLMIVSGIFCVLTFATFPNYRTTVICLIMLGLGSIFFLIGKEIQIGLDNKRGPQKTFRISLDTTSLYHFLKLLLIFGITFFLGSIWVGALIFSNFDILTSAYSEISSPWFAGGLEIFDVTRLIARWGFYSGALERPYIPYKDVYLSNPLIIFLCCLPSILAFTSLLSSKEHKITVFFGSIAAVAVLLTSGFSFSQYGDNLYTALTGLPLLMVFREASNWIFFVIFSFGILMGCTFSALCHKFKNKASKILIVSLAAMLFVSTSYPLTIGDVTRNWVDPNIKGSYFPPSYAELNGMLESEYWAIVLPQRSTYVVYNFTKGVLGSGNPYPLIFSKPVISGTGTEYIEAENVDIITKKLHEIVRTNINYESVERRGKVSASSIETVGFEPNKAIDGDVNNSRWSSNLGVPQWFEIEWNKTQELLNMVIIFESAYAKDYIVETWNGHNWTTQIVVENNTFKECYHPFQKPTPTRKLRLNFTKATHFQLISIWELKVYAQPTEVSKFLGTLGIRYLILEKKIIFGNYYSANELRLQENKKLSLVNDWEEVALFENEHALQKLYVAENVLNASSLDEMYERISDSEWSTLQYSVFLNLSSPNKITNKTLIMPEELVWKENSPTSYQVDVKSKGPFILVFLESYDEHWKISVNGDPIPETNHQRANTFANGWLIDVTGNLTIDIYYETQTLLLISTLVSIILPILLLMVFSREEIKKISHGISRKLKQRG